MKAALFFAIVALSNLLPWAAVRKKPSKRIKICAVGVFALKEFCVMLMGVIVYHLFMIGRISAGGWFISVGLWTVILTVLFWHGMILVYIFSVQLGVKKRAVGIILGLVPIANVVQLFKIIGTVDREVREESEKIKLNQKRKAERICDLKYPILLVHGVFFRDSRLLNYWGENPRGTYRQRSQDLLRRASVGGLSQGQCKRDCREDRMDREENGVRQGKYYSSLKGRA